MLLNGLVPVLAFHSFLCHAYHLHWRFQGIDATRRRPFHPSRRHPSSSLLLSWQERQDFDFSSSLAWEKFFREDPSYVTEWHDSINFDDLIQRWIPQHARVLVPGCGTSRLPHQLLQRECSVLLLDSSATCLNEMRRQWRDRIEDYLVGDATKLDDLVAISSIDVILDKGLLDAFLCGDGWETPVERLVTTAARVLRVDGSYVLVSYRLAEPTKVEIQNLSRDALEWEFGVEPSNEHVEVSIARRVGREG